ncbi:MAG: hypothetical protein AB1716_06740 [Planctomycetota bacterium]
MADIPGSEGMTGSESAGGEPMGIEPGRAGSAREEFSRRATQLKEHVRGAIPELRERVADVRADVRALASSAGQAAMEQLDPVEDYVRRYPLRSILIASGVGMVLGMIMRR